MRRYLASDRPWNAVPAPHSPGPIVSFKEPSERWRQRQPARSARHMRIVHVQVEGYVRVGTLASVRVWPTTATTALTYSLADLAKLQPVSRPSVPIQLVRESSRMFVFAVATCTRIASQMRSGPLIVQGKSIVLSRACRIGHRKPRTPAAGCLQVSRKDVARSS
jgi:hypothetical protein